MNKLLEENSETLTIEGKLYYDVLYSSFKTTFEADERGDILEDAEKVSLRAMMDALTVVKNRK